MKKEDKEHEEAIKTAVNAEPPSYPYIENIPYINYSELSLALMWHKKKGKSKYDQKDDSSWLGPYIVNKKSCYRTICTFPKPKASEGDWRNK